MKTFLSNLREALLDQRRIPMLFVIATFVTGLAVDDAASWWSRRTMLPEGVLALGVLGILLVIFQSPWFLLFWRGGTSPARVVPAGHCRGLVLLASPKGGIATAEKAVRWHEAALERVWILHSDLSRPEAEDLIARMKAERGYERITFEPLIHLSNADFENPDKVRAAIEERVYSKLPRAFPPEEVVIDFTGGLKATSAGAFLAGLPEGRRLQVNRAQRDDRGDPVNPGPPYEILLSYKIKRIFA